MNKLNLIVICLSVLISVLLFGCGDDGQSGDASDNSTTSNGTTSSNTGSGATGSGTTGSTTSGSTNNSSSSTNNGSSSTNNGSSSTNNGSSSTNNGSSSTNNGSSNTNNGSSSTNNGNVDVSEAEIAELVSACEATCDAIDEDSCPNLEYASEECLASCDYGTFLIESFAFPSADAASACAAAWLDLEECLGSASCEEVLDYFSADGTEDYACQGADLNVAEMCGEYYTE